MMMKKVILGILLVVMSCSEDTQLPEPPITSQLLSYTDAKGQQRAVQTVTDWEIKRTQLLDSMQAVMGPLPSFRNLPPLDIQYRDSLKEKNYTRYLINFTVAENEIVPAYLYIPASKEPDRKFPAMLALHQTRDWGKDDCDGGYTKNMGYAKELAHRGYIVLSPDYPPFGELKDYDFKTDRYLSGTMKGVFNHIRGVDMLQTLPNINSECIGVIGHSLGGHNAMFAAAFDTRLKIVVASCGWTEFEFYVADGRMKEWAQECYMPLFRDKYQLDGDRLPFNFHEVVALFAPRYFYSNSPVNDDDFHMEGVKAGIDSVKEVYRFLHAEENLLVRYPMVGHDFPPASRQEVYRLIDKIFNHQPDDPDWLFDN
jgi:hypothetical protein